MLKRSIGSLLILLFATLFFCQETIAQDNIVTVSQDSKFENLLKEKRRINSSITVNDGYKIQIFNGESEESKKILNDFRKQFKNLDGTIIFNTPFYKVLVGNFKSRVEAERNLAELRKTYSSALIIRPNK